MKDVGREPHHLPAQVGNRGAECEGAVHDVLPALRLRRAVSLIEAERRRAVGQSAEPKIIRFGNGAADRMIERLPDHQFVEE